VQNLGECGWNAGRTPLISSADQRLNLVANLIAAAQAS
jgi:hypothetical protein